MLKRSVCLCIFGRDRHEMCSCTLLVPIGLFTNNIANSKYLNSKLKSSILWIFSRDHDASNRFLKEKRICAQNML